MPGCSMIILNVLKSLKNVNKFPLILFLNCEDFIILIIFVFGTFVRIDLKYSIYVWGILICLIACLYVCIFIV